MHLENKLMYTTSIKFSQSLLGFHVRDLDLTSEKEECPSLSRYGLPCQIFFSTSPLHMDLLCSSSLQEKWLLSPLYSFPHLHRCKCKYIVKLFSHKEPTLVKGF